MLLSWNIQVQASRPYVDPYPRELKTLGDHVRKIRMDRKLMLKEAAKLMGVTNNTVFRWEHNIDIPTNPGYFSKLIQFLGYVPWEVLPAMETLGQKMRTYRMIEGWFYTELAQHLGVNPSSIVQWENDKAIPNAGNRKKLEAWLEEEVGKWGNRI